MLRVCDILSQVPQFLGSPALNSRHTLFRGVFADESLISKLEHGF